MIVLIPPHGDPTLEVVPDPWDDGAGRDVEVVDAGRAFVDRVRARPSRPPGGDRVAALMRTAGHTALCDATAGPVHRLRGLGALLSATGRPDDGVQLRLDDLELTAGTTQRSADVLHAAGRPAPYDEDVDAAADRAAAHRDVLLVVERDQQLPAALRLASRLGTGDRRLRVTGRYATACWDVLRGLPPLRGAGLDPAPRGLAWRTVDPFGCGSVPVVHWRERAADPVPDGPWAGRVALDRLDDARGAHTAVVGLCADPDRALGRGGTELHWPELRRRVGGLRASGTTVLAELWLGAPGTDPARAADALRTVADVVDRVVGLRVFDWPVAWSEHLWAGHPVEVAATGDDLARHHRVGGPTDAAATAGLVTTLGRPLARDGALVPGRVAAAYLVPPPSGPGDDGPELDPDVVLGGRARDGRGVAVNLRTGACTPVDAAVADLVASRPDDGHRRRTLGALPADVLSRLRDTGVVRG